MDLDLSGKHALVCGASEGIGLAAARELALLGADVTLLARREDALRAACESLPQRDGQKHGFIIADAAQTDALAKTTAELAAKHPMQILINNTGGPRTRRRFLPTSTPSPATSSPTRPWCRRCCRECAMRNGAASST